MDNYIGFLSPAGTFHHCPYYGHMEKAKDLVFRFYDKSMNGAVAEEFLYSEGWCVFYARHFGWQSFRTDAYEPLQPKQREFLLEAIKNCNIDEKVEEIKAALRLDEVIRNTPREDGRANDEQQR